MNTLLPLTEAFLRQAAAMEAEPPLWKRSERAVLKDDFANDFIHDC
ncbi:hypothetical protein [Variovorax sp. VaC1]